MSEVKHTLGPWESVQGSTTGRLVISPASPKSKRNIAHVGGPDRDANGRLIAAAPDLLAELDCRVGDLVLLIKAIEADDPKAELLFRANDMLRNTRAAIAKAGIARSSTPAKGE